MQTALNSIQKLIGYFDKFQWHSNNHILFFLSSLSRQPYILRHSSLYRFRFLFHNQYSFSISQNHHNNITKKQNLSKQMKYPHGAKPKFYSKNKPICWLAMKYFYSRAKNKEFFEFFLFHKEWNEFCQELCFIILLYYATCAPVFWA